MLKKFKGNDKTFCDNQKFDSDQEGYIKKNNQRITKRINDD